MYAHRPRLRHGWSTRGTFKCPLSRPARTSWFSTHRQNWNEERTAAAEISPTKIASFIKDHRCKAHRLPDLTLASRHHCSLRSIAATWRPAGGHPLLEASIQQMIALPDMACPCYTTSCLLNAMLFGAVLQSLHWGTMRGIAPAEPDEEGSPE